MGLQDRDYMQREEKKPVYENKREKTEKKYFSALKNISLTMVLLGLIAITAIMAMLPSKTNTYNPVPEPKNEKQQIVKGWKKTMICNADGSECKTSYSK